MKIGLSYNLKDELYPDAILDSEAVEEFDSARTIDAICDVFEKNGHEIVKLGYGLQIIERVKIEGIKFVFNIAEGYKGRNRESHVPAILESLRIPYSGSDPLTLGLTLDKAITKKIASGAGIPVPRYKVVEGLEDIFKIENILSYPLITKPAWEGSSKGIYNSSKVTDKNELQKNVLFLLEKYPDQPILVDEYIEGREITAAVIGNKNPAVLGLMEIVNKKEPGEDFFYSLEVKKDWQNLVDYVSPPEIGESLNKRIRHYAISAFKEFGCRDIARIDFRISKDDEIYMLEINPLPGLSPEYADLVIMAKKQGIEYENLILAILHTALARYNLTQQKIDLKRQDISR